MADNTQLDSGTGGVIATSLEITFAGDTTQLQAVALVGASGSEGSYTTALIAGTAANGIDVDVTRVTGTVTVDGSGVTQPVSNGGTFVVQEDGAALTALQLIDDIVVTFGTSTYAETTTKGAVAGAVRNDTLAALADTDNEIAPLQVNSSGALYTTISGTVTVAAHAVTNAGTFAVQVDAALPAGTNAIGKLAANSGVDIGDVDVTSVTPGTAAANLGKAEDAAHTTGDVGVMPLAVRNDDLATLAGTDGDYAPLQVTQNGALLTCPAANDDYKFAKIDAATSGDNTIQAAAGAGVKIRVLAAFLVSAGTVNARFESGAAGTALTGQMNLVVNSGFTLPFNPAGWFETGANVLLNLELSAAISVDGAITYIEVV